MTRRDKNGSDVTGLRHVLVTLGEDHRLTSIALGIGDIAPKVITSEGTHQRVILASGVLDVAGARQREIVCSAPG